MHAAAVTLAFALTTFLSAGCLGDDGPPREDPAADAGVPVFRADNTAFDPWAQNLTEAVLLDLDGGTIETDVPCLNSYAIRHARQADWWITPGTDRVVIDYGMTGANTGYQVGWSAAGGDIQWSDVVATGGTGTITIPVDESTAETDGRTWEFYHRMNIPVVEPDCYAGGGASDWTLTVTIYP